MTPAVDGMILAGVVATGCDLVLPRNCRSSVERGGIRPL